MMMMVGRRDVKNDALMIFHQLKMEPTDQSISVMFYLNVPSCVYVSVGHCACVCVRVCVCVRACVHECSDLCVPTPYTLWGRIVQLKGRWVQSQESVPSLGSIK